MISFKAWSLSKFRQLRVQYPSIYRVLYPVASKFVSLYYKLLLKKLNRVNNSSSVFNSIHYEIRGRKNSITIDKGASIKNLKLKILGDNNIVHIGANVEFRNAGSIWIEDSNSILTIGENTTFQDVHIALTEDNSKVSIGKDCMFAYDIDIRTGDSHSVVDGKTGERLNRARDIQIQDHVWIAAHARILKGVIISKDSVVATSAVLTREYSSPGSVIAGNPANVVKTNINLLRERI